MQIIIFPVKERGKRIVVLNTKHNNLILHGGFHLVVYQRQENNTNQVQIVFPRKGTRIQHNLYMIQQYMVAHCAPAMTRPWHGKGQ